MPIYDNGWDDKYWSLTKEMSPREMDTFVHGLVGAMSPFLDTETVEHCLKVAELLFKSDLHLVRR